MFQLHDFDDGLTPRPGQKSVVTVVSASAAPIINPNRRVLFTVQDRGENILQAVAGDIVVIQPSDWEKVRKTFIVLFLLLLKRMIRREENGSGRLCAAKQVFLFLFLLTCFSVSNALSTQDGYRPRMWNKQCVSFLEKSFNVEIRCLAG